MKYLLFSLLVIVIILLPTCNILIEDGNLIVKKKSRFHSLLWTEYEVKYIANRIPNSQIFTYENATEQNFKSVASNAKILHFAAHTVIDDNNPMYSRLILRSDPHGMEDGYLNTYEIHNIRLNTELVVLSGCNTGIGKLVNSEGMLSLARGFKYAGCASMVVSLWPIDDRATSDIMNDFYRHLTSRIDISKSLHQAKLEYIEMAAPETAAPFYWAGLINLGKNRIIEMEESSPSNRNFIVIIITILISLVIARLFLYA
jgi:CHAT domain-containing protein